jgi:predicted small lipoprotein YifL
MMQRTQGKRILLSGMFVATLALGALAGCEEKGPAEKAGEAIDEAAKDTKRAIEDATD